MTNDYLLLIFHLHVLILYMQNSAMHFFFKYDVPVQDYFSLLINISFHFIPSVYSNISVTDLLDVTLNL